MRRLFGRMRLDWDSYWIPKREEIGLCFMQTRLNAYLKCVSMNRHSYTHKFQQSSIANTSKLYTENSAACWN